jgi:hypothetical protein
LRSTFATLPDVHELEAWINRNEQHALAAAVPVSLTDPAWRVLSRGRLRTHTHGLFLAAAALAMQRTPAGWVVIPAVVHSPEIACPFELVPVLAMESDAEYFSNADAWSTARDLTFGQLNPLLAVVWTYRDAVSDFAARVDAVARAGSS